MAEGYECDRCGGLHSGPPDTLLTVGDGMDRHGRQDGNEGMSLFGDEMYDVCPGCEASFREWWGAE